MTVYEVDREMAWRHGLFFNSARAKLNLFLGDDWVAILFANQKDCKSQVEQTALLYDGAYLGA